ncbi:MAG: tetratricopeptide repeat protein, partial [Acidobacteriota bacterium]
MRASQTARSIDAAEYPTFDASVLMLVSAGLASKQAQASARNIDDPEAARLLAGAGQPAESLKHLRQFVERHPDQIARAFKGLSTTSYTMDQSQPYAAELAEIVGLAKRQLERLPREDAATAARILVSFEAGLDRGNPRRPWPDRLDEFVRTYAGTEAALLTEVDLISAGRLDRSRLDALEGFARRHPGTAVAAKALYQKAFDLAHNASGLRLETPGSDPTQRFLQVVDLSKELESGRYPKCEWTDQAPQLISGFYSYQPKYSLENIEVMLKTYEEFVRTHFVLDSRPAENGVGYVISTKMGDLFALRGERIAGVERLLTDLAGGKINPGELESFRAAFYIRQLFQDSVNREEMLAKAFATLDKLQAAKVEPYSRRALATAASLHFFERDYPAARDAYQRYLTAYPQSPWAWVAALRLGQSWTAVGDLNRAAAAFDDAPARSDLPVARVLGRAYAAEAFAGLGRADIALTHARQALEDWDDDFGVQYRFQAQQRRLPGDEPFAIPADMTIAKETLPARIVQLERSAGRPAGGLVEQGRWLIGKGRFDEAKKVLDRAAAAVRGTPLEAETRTLVHRAALERALILADLQNPQADERAALQELDRLAAEPLDFAVFAARLAAATIVSRRDASTADVRISSALNDWLAGQPKGTSPPLGTLEADV